MNRNHEPMTDRELDLLLVHATVPSLPEGARDRLMQRLAGEASSPPANTVVPFRRAAAAPSRIGWLAGLPLAASLALGIYLGSGGTLESYLPSTAYDMLAGNSDDAVTGIEDVESFNEDDLS